MEANTPITGTLRTLDNGQTYSFSVRAFKSWKRKFQQEYLDQFGNGFKEDVPSSSEKENIYRAALHMSSVDIFQTGREFHTLSEAMFYRVQKVQKILGNNL